MVKVPYDTLVDAVAVTMHERFNKDQKRAARLIKEHEDISNLILNKKLYN